MKKLLIAMLLALSMAFGAVAFVACDNGEEPPETTHTEHIDADGDGKCDECGTDMGGEPVTPGKLTLTDGIYICDPIDMGSGRGNAYNYIRFHENGIFYYAQMANSSTPGGGLGQEAGYYEVIEEDLTFEDKTDESQTVERTAESYIVLTNFDGTPCNIRAVNSGETMTNEIPLYEDALYGIWYDNMIYRHDGDPDFTIDQETLIAVAEFVDPSNSFNTVSVGHNGRFDDNIAFDEGEWSYDEATRTYTLTGEYDTATLVVSEDGTVAVYTCGETTMTLNNTDAPQSGEVTAAVEVSDATNMFTLGFYNDGSYAVTASFGGQTMEMTSGNWSLTIPTLTLDETDYTMSSDGITVSLTLKTSQGEGEYTFALTREQLIELSEVEIISPEPEIETLVQQADETGMMTLSFYNDGTYDVVAGVSGQTQTMQEGEWSLNIPYFTVGAFETMMTGGDVTVTLTITTTGGDMPFSFILTTEQLTALNG